MNINFGKEVEKEFLIFFQKLYEHKDLFYTKEQLVKLETQTYEILLFDIFVWKDRNLYLKLFTNFLNCNISGDEFSEQLIGIRKYHIREFQELMNRPKINLVFLNKFDPDINAFGFTDIIDSVYEYCDSFVSDELLAEIGDLREDGAINEDQLRKHIEKAFLQIMLTKYSWS